MKAQQKELMDNWDNCKSIRLNVDGFGDIDVSSNSDEVHFGNLPLQFIYPYVSKIDLKKGYLSNYKNIKPGFWVEMQDDKQYCCGEIEKIEGLERIRFMTSHPKDLSDELIEVMANSKKICKHLHLPMQSGSTRILKEMNRKYTKESYLELAERIKKAIPDISLTTDIIVGFPGETHEDVDETIDVVRKVGFDNAFTFIYSKRTGTPAAAMENQVPEDIVKEEFNRVLEAVQEVSKERTGGLEGQIVDVLFEEINDHDDSMLTGRMSNNTLVHAVADKSLIGKILPVKLVESKGFYYMGELVLQ